MDYTCDKLGLKIGETTADGLLKLEVLVFRCLWLCSMMQLGDFLKEHLTKDKLISNY
jgi:NADH-quinone oxidoreductase subunit E